MSGSILLKYLRNKHPDKGQIEVTKWFGNEMIIRFQYIADLDEELRVKALIKVIDATVTPENALAYLVTRYPDRHNIEIIEMVTD